MGGRGRLAWVAAVAAVVCFGWAAQADAFVYWANGIGQTIGRANLDGSGVDQTFITGASDPAGVAVDARHIYWANVATGTIGRANLDGSGVDQTFITGANPDWGVAVDGQHIYWAQQGMGRIGRANLDGSGVNQSFIALPLPSWVAVDAQHLYLTREGVATIGRANLDGSGVDQSFITGADSPFGLAVDAQHVYWTNFSGNGTIGRANLDGSGVDQSFITGAFNPWGVAVDGRHVYWTNRLGIGTIGRANLDGSDADQSFIAGANNPVGVAVDAGPGGSASASPTSLAFGGQPLGTLGAPRSVTITNLGPGNLEIEAARLTGGDVDDFLVTSDGCSQTTLALGETCALHLRFAPSATGERRATLALTSNDPASPLRIALEGSGELPQVPPGETSPAVPAAPVLPAPPPPRGRAGPAIAGLRLGSRCARPTRSGRVRVSLSMRLARPGPIQVRLERGVGTRALRSCPRPNPSRRFTGSFRTVATLGRAPTQPAAAAAAVGRRLTLTLRLAPGLYRITVRARLDGNRLSRPARRYLRVLSR
jgi:virginiamycin B lyase